MKTEARLVAVVILAAAVVTVSLVVVLPMLVASLSLSPTRQPSPSYAWPTGSVLSNPSSAPTRTAPPTATPGPTPIFAACGQAHETVPPLVLRVEHSSDTGRDWVISIYTDGRVLSPALAPGDFSDHAWMLARQLTPSGIGTLRDEVLATGLFGKSATYSPIALRGVQPPGRGASGYVITLGSGSRAIQVSWTSMFGDDALYYEPSPERERLDVLGARMMAFDSWLPDGAWLARDPCTYQALRFRVFIEAQAYGGAMDDLRPDISTVPWPLGGEILAWGADVGQQLSDYPFHLERCGMVPRGVATSLEGKLREAGALDPFTTPTTLDSGYIELQLGDSAGVRIVSIFIQPLLPDDTRCTEADHPYGGGEI